MKRAVLPFLCLLASAVSISYLFNSAGNSMTARVSRGIGASSSTALPLYLTSSSSDQDLYGTDIRDSLTNVLPPGFDRASDTIDTKKKCDICMVGASLSGAIFSKRSDNVLGKSVLVLDTRSHIGGYCYDFVDAETGILRNQYGAHLFHTSIDKVWKYLNYFANAPKWVRWDHEVHGIVDGKLVSIPMNTNIVNKLLRDNIQTEEEMK